MQIEQTRLLTVLSEALDSVEKEILGTTDHHAKRVAWLCIRMAKKLGLSQREISCLAVSALFHDSALNEYRQDYRNNAARTPALVGGHCIAGEENLRMILGEDLSYHFVRYHHECADGSGPFGKNEKETPLGAQILHIADQIDRRTPLGAVTESELSSLREYIQQQKHHLFGAQVCELLLSELTEETLSELSEAQLAQVDLEISDLPGETDLRTLSGLFARIIDYKSPFTKDHSVGVAEKAETMARFYGWDAETTEQIYCAGALHDIGKLMVSRDVLEKPGKLDPSEYQHIQSHAMETYRLLSKLDTLESVTRWASFHHEKLDGRGYPFGKTADDLDEKSRLLACLDIYQALTEDRPYKSGMTHQKAMSILWELVEKGELDRRIVRDIGEVFHRAENEVEIKHTALFQCPVCGHIYDGDAMPEKYDCPVCGQPETAFLRIR